MKNTPDTSRNHALVKLGIGSHLGPSHGDPMVSNSHHGIPPGARCMDQHGRWVRAIGASGDENSDPFLVLSLSQLPKGLDERGK